MLRRSLLTLSLVLLALPLIAQDTAVAVQSESHLVRNLFIVLIVFAVLGGGFYWYRQSRPYKYTPPKSQ